MNNMKKYNDLEMSILSCLLLRPEYMESLIIEDKHFIKHKKLWVFMKEFYNKFHNFDLVLMCSINKNRYEMISYIEMLLDVEPAPSLCLEYQRQLIDLYNEEKKERYKIEKIYELANSLLVRNITTKEFGLKVNEVFKNANEIFKEN